MSVSLSVLFLLSPSVCLSHSKAQRKDAGFCPLLPPTIYSFRPIYQSCASPSLSSSGVFLRSYYNHCLLFLTTPCSVTALALHMDHSIPDKDSINTEIQRAVSSSSHEFCSRNDDYHDTEGWVGLEDAYSQSEESNVTGLFPPSIRM